MARKGTGGRQGSLFGGGSKRKTPSTKGARWSQRSGYKAVRVRVEGHTRTVYKKKGN